jgi:hypothetical protein
VRPTGPDPAHRPRVGPGWTVTMRMTHYHTIHPID